MIDVAILTEKRYLAPNKKNWYTENILIEDGLILSEFERLGISCKRVAWDVEDNVQGFKCALFRTTWNYFDKLDSFLSFLTNCKNRTILVNPYEQIIWNLDKKYLIELSKRGINIPPTRIIKRGNKQTLLTVCEKFEWTDIVFKPCVSAAAWNTHYVKKLDVLAHENLFQNLVSQQDMMVQEFQKNIKIFGEISLMMIGGTYTHAVLKRAKKGDFRVQDDYGGTIAPYNAAKKEIDFALRVLNALSFKPLYARVDLVVDNNNKLALSELELIEPEMWFRLQPSSAKKLANSIKEKYF